MLTWPQPLHTATGTSPSLASSQVTSTIISHIYSPIQVLGEWNYKVASIMNSEMLLARLHHWTIFTACFFFRCMAVYYSHLSWEIHFWDTTFLVSRRFSKKLSAGMICLFETTHHILPIYFFCQNVISNSLILHRLW